MRSRCSNGSWLVERILLEDETYQTDLIGQPKSQWEVSQLVWTKTIEG